MNNEKDRKVILTPGKRTLESVQTLVLDDRWVRQKVRSSGVLPHPDEALAMIQSAYPDQPSPPFLLRLVEILVSAITLVLTLPLMLLIGIVIRLDSPGPALFRQKRIGQGGRLFNFVKFRTYYTDAKDRFPELYRYRYSQEELNHLHFKVPGDRRATRVGKWLRQTTLDELPNFWNVLTGDVALVGPRPEIPEMAPYYQPDELAKFSVRPGITGLAQISGRGRLSFRETLRYDLDYVKQNSRSGDVKITIRTLKLIVLRDGAF